jgi:cobaltochelatase CobN
MHLLVSQSGTIDDGSEPRDLGQTPGDIVVLSFAESELALLADAQRALAANGSPPSLRLANLAQLKHNFSVDLYAEKTLPSARVVVLRLLGGKSYWSYGLERLTELAQDGGPQLVVLPGDDQQDPQLEGLSTVDEDKRRRLWTYLSEGGADNARGFLESLAALIEAREPPPPARPLLKAGLYWPGLRHPNVKTLQSRWQVGGPVAALIFYRALLQSGDLAAVDALIAGLSERGLNPLPIYVNSLREPFGAETIRTLFSQAAPDIILNSTAFAATLGATESTRAFSTEMGTEERISPFAGLDAMVLQIVFSGESQERWASGTRGLSPHYIAMHVALPEVDGRVLTRAVSFKSDRGFDPVTEYYVTRAEPKRDRIAFTASLAAAWVRLRRTPVSERRLALILANYPNKDARLANGVGLDTPQSAVEILRALAANGYRAGRIPANGNALIETLLEGPTNAAPRRGDCPELLPLATYREHFSQLPEKVQAEVTARWGEPDADPFFADGAFVIPVLRQGNVAIGVQPARGYNIDPKGSYHDPALVPPHGYFAFYIWLREIMGVHAAVHLGKHGNLEWLPGKALALSEACYPEAVLGPMPNIYPFIVNDPGEGAQAKRRTAAVIVDHLTPPMTRAEIYGELKELEALVDEYFEAASVDEARRRHLAGEIIAATARLGLDKDCGIDLASQQDEALAALDNHLCELKEMQIRDGLHIFGRAPDGDPRTDLLVALARVPRGSGESGDASLIRALAADLGLTGFDPLGCKLGEAWTGVRPRPLAEISDAPWRTNGDTVERLELLARRLVAGLKRELREMRIAPLTRRFAPPSPARGEGRLAAPTSQTSSLRVAARSPSPLAGEGGTRSVPGEGGDPHLGDLSAEFAAKVAEGDARFGAWPATRTVLETIRANLAPKIDGCGKAEIDGLLTALSGRFVASGPSGAPTRGRPDVLPTGRNFYSLDSRTLPTPAAWELGRRSAELVIERYVQDHGDWPRSLVLSAWGTANMRTGGDDIAQALALMGVKPAWEPASRRVTGFEIIPLARLGRPRVDVTFRVSGFFRDAFPAQLDLLDSAVRAIAGLKEPAGENPLAENALREAERLMAEGAPVALAGRIASARIFGSKPGAYGAGLQALIDEGIWEGEGDFAESYLTWGQYAYGAGLDGRAERSAFERRLAGVDVILHNQDNREHDLLDSDDYYQFAGGLAASVKALKGAPVRIYHNDHSRPERPVVRALEEEIGRVVRARAANPKWLAGIMRHGYKGGFEIAATVDYLFAFAATTGAVGDHHFEALYEAYIADEAVRGFLARNNLAALADIEARFREAVERRLWTPRSNSAMAGLAGIARKEREP